MAAVGNGGSYTPVISADGYEVAFESDADNSGRTNAPYGNIYAGARRHVPEN